MPESHNGNRRLDSWKEIAAHLGRNERTAVRWEKRGLPVHRVPGGQRQAVFAYTDEIDTWLIGQNGRTATSNLCIEPATKADEPKLESTELPIEPNAERIHDQVSRNGKWRNFIAVICILALTATVIVLLARPHASAAISPFQFTQVTNDGKFKIAFRTDERTLFINEVEGTHTILTSRPIAGGPARQIVTSFSNVLLEDISNDGQSLLVTSFQGIESEKPLWIIPVRGGPAHRVGNILCEQARWSPDNQRIACTYGTSIIVLRSDGSEPHPIASFPSIPSNLLWSPDGQQLRFLLRDATAHSLSAWQIDIGNETNPVTTIIPKPVESKNVCWDWTWTKYGENLICVGTDSDRPSGLTVISQKKPPTSFSTTTAELPLKMQTVISLAPGSSENAAYILVANPSRGELFRFDTKRKVLETFLHSASVYYVSFSRDGQWITYVNSVDQSLWRSRLDGTEALQLTTPPVEVEMSSWSPDGRRIAYMARIPGKPWRIFLVDRDGAAREEVSVGDDNQGAPTWAPDGKSLVYANVDCTETQNCWVRRIDLANREIELVPNSHGLRTARWSPDGKYIAALQSQTYELRLFDVRRQRWRMLADSITGDNINWTSDSQFVYVDSPHGENPRIERIRIRDGERTTVMSLASWHNVFGHVDNWIGLDPDDSPILFHNFTASEVYSLQWTNP